MQPAQFNSARIPLWPRAGPLRPLPAPHSSLRALCPHPLPLLAHAPPQLPTPAQPPLHSRGFAAIAAAAAPDAGGAAASLVDRIKSDMKDAMKAKDQARLDAIRFLNAAIKQREIELREAGGAVNDEEVIKVRAPCGPQAQARRRKSDTAAVPPTCLLSVCRPHDCQQQAPLVRRPPQPTMPTR